MVRRRSRWRLMGIGVLAVWTAVLAWYVRRQYDRPLSTRLVEASANLVPAASYYSIKLGDAPVGYAATRIDTVAEGFVLEDDMRLRIVALGSDVPAAARTLVRLGKRLELQGFEFDLRSDVGDFHVSGAMRGDSVLDLKIRAGGDEQDLEIPIDGPVILPQVMPMRFALGSEPSEGNTYSFEVFDPSVLERQTVTLEVLGRETLVYADSVDFDQSSGNWIVQTYDTVDTWHVRQKFGGVEMDSWLDPDGMVVRAASPLGYSIERTAFEIAWNEYRALETSASGSLALEAPDIIERTAISVGVDLPEGERIGELAVRLRNVDLDGFDLKGGRQRLAGDTLYVLSEPPPEPGYSLPADSAEWGAELAATPLIQAGDPRIRRAARAAVGDTSDPAVAAGRLERWVYDSLDKQVTMSIPSALQVLEARRGDCNEHTVLYVAMARALGLPARTAAGLVYVRGRFYYHAWPEVWLGRWVPVDPTLGQYPADASHLRFVIGGLARQVELVRLIGLLQLDVVSVEER